MSLLDKIEQSLLNRSNSYNFYKNSYENIKKQETKIDKLTKNNNEYKKKIEELKSINQKYEEENKYLKSLLDYEIKNIETYMYELIEMKNNNK